jgi:hypothetical protein
MVLNRPPISVSTGARGKSAVSVPIVAVAAVAFCSLVYLLCVDDPFGEDVSVVDDIVETSEMAKTAALESLSAMLTKEKLPLAAMKFLACLPEVLLTWLAG